MGQKGHHKGNKKRRSSQSSAAGDDERLAEVRKRCLAINSYLDIIPARLYLGTDNAQVLANKGPWDPKKTMTTSQVVAADAIAQDTAEAEGGEGEGGGGEAAAGAMSKAAKRRQQRRGGKTPEEAAAAKEKAQAATGGGVFTRAELHAKLERRIAELKEERRRRQQEKDKAAAADARAKKSGEEPKAGQAKASPKMRQAADPNISAEVGRLSFDGAVSASVPFEASVGRRGDKVRRLRGEMRKHENEEERLRRAEEQGNAEDVRQELALQKAMRRARGEKVHDDAAKLRKAQKALEVKRKKGKERWDQLKDAQKKMTESKQDKRKENLAKPRGKKRKLRSGFEGQRGSAFINSEK